MAILKFILVVALLAGMVLVLLSIGHLSAGTFHHDSDDLDNLRREVDEEEDVIGKASAFHSFVSGRDRGTRRASK